MLCLFREENDGSAGLRDGAWLNTALYNDPRKGSALGLQGRLEPQFHREQAGAEIGQRCLVVTQLLFQARGPSLMILTTLGKFVPCGFEFTAIDRRLRQSKRLARLSQFLPSLFQLLARFGPDRSEFFTALRILLGTFQLGFSQADLTLPLLLALFHILLCLSQIVLGVFQGDLEVRLGIRSPAEPGGELLLPLADSLLLGLDLGLQGGQIEQKQEFTLLHRLTFPTEDLENAHIGKRFRNDNRSDGRAWLECPRSAHHKGH